MGGLVTASLQKSAFAAVSSQRAIVVLNAAMGIVLAVAFEKLSPASEAHGTLPKSEGMTGLLGIGASRGIVLHFSSAGHTAGRTDRPCADDGVYTPPVQCLADPCPANAQSATRHCISADSVQHLTDGRANQTVLHDGSRCAVREIRGSLNYGCGSHNRCRHRSAVYGSTLLKSGIDRLPILHRRHAEDRLRPAALSCIHRTPADRRERLVATARKRHALLKGRRIANVEPLPS